MNWFLSKTVIMYNSPYQKQGFISFTVASDGEYNNGKGKRSQSCRRMWNQLSRLQRSIIFIILFLGLVCAVYIFPGLYSNYMNSNDETTFFSRNKISAKDGGEGVIDAPPNMQDLRDRAAQQVQEIMDRRKPVKKGPPRIKGNIHDIEQQLPVPNDGINEEVNITRYNHTSTTISCHLAH
ncbi:uncharacterized protein LOC100366477 [Saccoglossus kowalevskii]|uniref:Endoplasmic reticulum mannosyl-oligosaccharide 1,2-alpha-mannosidase-like n=1 Tax=Saccoglossus kowalevskii TaxID=10224 RepID=A0ABM0GXF7_SACKO|nr:PREDICTED: endoplasmic reticulum mannosyl-oligosaccharide 1,2-alpha-mannosidase-like [Saccoglossus kowalevskii]